MLVHCPSKWLFQGSVLSPLPKDNNSYPLQNGVATCNIFMKLLVESIESLEYSTISLLMVSNNILLPQSVRNSYYCPLAMSGGCEQPKVQAEIESKQDGVAICTSVCLFLDEQVLLVKK